MNIKEIATGTAITLLIGGTAYTISKDDIASNLASDTGMTTEQAQEYVNSVTEEDLVSFDEMGRDIIEMGNEDRTTASEIDCENYEYEWETESLSCAQGKEQLNRLATDEIELGEAYIVLNADTAGDTDIANTIRLIDALNADLQLEIVTWMLDPADITEMKNTNSYNKALLQAALESGE